MIITGKAIVVYAKKDDELYFFKIYDYPKQEDEAHEKFKELFSDDSLEVYSMTIDHFNKLI